MADELPIADIFLLTVFAEAASRQKRLDARLVAMLIRKGGRPLGVRRWLWGRRRAVERRVRRLTERGLLAEVDGRVAITAEGRRTALDALAALEVADFMPPYLEQDREDEKYGGQQRYNRRRWL
jgi:hypothetical protein